MFGGEPMRSQGQAAVRLVGRAQAVKTPKCFWERDITKVFTLAPPMIPKRAQVKIGRRGIRRKKAADAEQTRLQMNDAGTILEQTLAQFGQALHRPEILLVTKGAKNSFPKRLLPA